MSESKRVTPETETLLTSLKVGVFMTVLGWMVLAIEAPQLLSAPDASQVHAMAQSAETAAAAPAPTDYFPAQFPAPKGEVEATPATF